MIKKFNIFKGCIFSDDKFLIFKFDDKLISISNKIKEISKWTIEKRIEIGKNSKRLYKIET